MAAGNSTVVKAALIGLNCIAGQHLKAIQETPGMELVGVCDLNPELVERRSKEENVPGYTDLEKMISEQHPDLVTLATDTGSHAKLTVLCAGLGVRAIHCEKPMSVHPIDARQMVAACEAANVLLTINHQRRMGDVGTVVEAIERGVLGEIQEVRGYCAGDFLSDGTHLLHSLMALAGNPEIHQVQAGLDLSEVSPRFGHLTERGAHVTVKCANGLNLELSTGSFATRRAYQEYHLAGSKGMICRIGDQLRPNWFICDGKPGTLEMRPDREAWFSHPVASDHGGPWRPLEGVGEPNAPKEVYSGIHRSLSTGEAHPLSGQATLQVQEIITAVYLSGLKRAPVTMADVAQEDLFPLMNPRYHQAD